MHKSCAKKLLYENSAHKILVKLTPGKLSVAKLAFWVCQSGVSRPDKQNLAKDEHSSLLCSNVSGKEEKFNHLIQDVNVTKTFFLFVTNVSDNLVGLSIHSSLFILA